MAVGTLLSELPVGRLHQDWASQRGLFDVQPQMTRVFLEQQAAQIAEALLARSRQIRFMLPDRIVLPEGAEVARVPPGSRRQQTGGWLWQRPAEQAREALIQILSALEQDSDPALSAAGSALRYALASTMIHNMLPDGRPVTYAPAEGDVIPSLPLGDGSAATSALIAATDAIAEAEAGDDGRVQVPFAPYARRFFLPQWVALDENDQLLVSKVSEAEACVASMQRYADILHHAVAIAPYVVADETYQRKRAGMLGQLVNQGRSLARFYTRRIIATIERRAREGSLNRGVNLTLPYFDDQQLKLRNYEMTVIPQGRILFVPAFVVRAVRLEAAKVAQDTPINSSTRKHLLAEFGMLEDAFLNYSLQ